MAEPKVFYLVCLECGDPERPLPIPFDSAAERGKWAAEHTRGTGHNRWWVKDKTVTDRAREDVRQMWNAAFGHDP